MWVSVSENPQYLAQSRSGTGLAMHRPVLRLGYCVLSLSKRGNLGCLVGGSVPPISLQPALSAASGFA